jgi:hypothetical protein
VQVSARSQLVPVARAAEIRSGSKGNLLRQLVSANVDAGGAGCSEKDGCMHYQPAAAAGLSTRRCRWGGLR